MRTCKEYLLVTAVALSACSYTRTATETRIALLYDSAAQRPDVGVVSVVAGTVTALNGASAVHTGLLTIPSAASKLVEAPANVADNLTTTTKTQ